MLASWRHGRFRVRVVVLMLALACVPARAEPRLAPDWRATLRLATAFFSDPASIRRNNCARAIDRFLDPLASASAEDMLAHPGDGAAREAVRAFFDLRLLIKRRLDGLAAPDPACVDAFRRALRFSRFAEDYLVEHLYAAEARSAAPSALFSDGYPHTTVARGASERIALRTGDVVMMRATSFVSAMIGRAGVEEGDFSHLMIVGEDAAGRQFAVEARIEEGVSVKPLADYMRNVEARAVLMRHRDPALARRAGRMIHDFAARAVAGGHPVPYDFSLDVDDHKRVFCAELIRVAYEMASGGAVRLPAYRSRIKRFPRSSFLRDFGLTITSTFLPSDIELDPRFEIIAEYRNVPLLREIRVRNAAVTSLYRWLGAGYSFRAEPMMDAIGPTLVQWRFGAAAVDGIPPRRLALFVKIQTAMDMIEANAFARDAAWRAGHGHGLTFPELLAVNESYRREDCRAFAGPFASAAQASDFTLHRLLNVDGGACPRR